MAAARCLSSVLPQPAEEVLERRRDGLQHPREDVEETPRTLLAAAVVAIPVLLAALAVLVPLVFDLPLLLRVGVVHDNLAGYFPFTFQQQLLKLSFWKIKDMPNPPRPRQLYSCGERMLYVW